MHPPSSCSSPLVRRRCAAGGAAGVVMASEKYDYDLVIIGAGVGGHGAALHARECGLKTAIIEVPSLPRASTIIKLLVVLLKTPLCY